MVLLISAALVASSCAREAEPDESAPQWENAGGAASTTPAPTTLVPTTAAPSPTPSATASPSATPKRSPSKSTATTTGRWKYVFPVAASKISYHPTHSAYPATDIFADCGEPVVAVTDGQVLEVSRVDKYSKSGPQGPYNGGLSVSVLGDDGVRYYGSHLTVVQSGIEAGVRVRAGQRLGTVGRTGNANNVCHLHFGISPPCKRTGDWWIRRGVIWPASYLDAWRKKTNKTPVDKVKSWQRANGCPSAP